MTEPLERNNVIELLKRLGSDQDEAVLDAARQLHAQITVADMAWEELLVPDVAADAADDYDIDDDDIDGDDIDGDDVDDQDSEDETPEPPPEPPAETARKDADTLLLINKLLANTAISEDLREELESYKTDIGEGEFEEADRRYILAVHDRLSKRR